ncbi:hypoxia up-regulated protein 1 [Cylas formicarius]|uniref:hypoxia up-regulated protein 1 n=1 Tax=Cylas formicarius TaxID=197179 RepID=UPI0029584C77|nr:hypoxia up-regulated protein 1 [Cylas formicarius]
MRLPITLLCLVISHMRITNVASLAVMSVDLGSEWMKVGIVSPGVPMEIALNKESKRKTPVVISFRDNVRLFGEDAQTVGLRFPKQAYSYLIELLGKSIDHPLVKLYQKRFPYYEIVPDTERGSVLFKQDEQTFYSPEELVAQLLAKAKEFAENGAHQPIKECVLTVPGFFNQVERKALLQAAQMAGLKVLQLINDYTAVALNYGIFRSKSFNETAQYVMFYDMGASSTTATLVSYQTLKTKERGYVETNPQVSVLGVGYDRTLGGLEIQLRLRDYLATKFNEMKKTPTDVFENPRALAKLFKEAGRLKNVLSANVEHYAQVEGLLDEQDFKFLVTRDDLEGLIKDLFDRVPKPVEQALQAAHLTLDVINQVVLVGAGTRVPKIQEVLQKAVNQELAKNLNTDEAATMGAVYKAADLSTGFKVSKFITKDAVLYPIVVTFQRDVGDGVKTVKRTLFGLMNPYPQKKIITFNKHVSDFNFIVSYGELEHLPGNEILNLGAKNLTEYKLTGVEEAIKKTLGENMESKGIKAHFNMDESGVLHLANVELVVEKTILPSEEDEGTLSKIGTTFSKLFGGKEEKPEPEENPPTDEKPVHEVHEEEAKQENVKKENSTSDEKKPNTMEFKNNTGAQSLKEEKPKIVTVKEPIQSSEIILSLGVLGKDQLEKSLEKIKLLDDIERDINRRATALNNLESFVIDVQNKLYENEYSEAGTEEEIGKIRDVCAQISDWLYDEGSDADANTYEKKLDEIATLTKPLFSRVWEHKERPEALKALHSMLNHSSTFLLTAQNLTAETNPDKDIFTDVEVEALSKLIVETTEWAEKTVKDQEALKKHEPVKLTVKSLMDKIGALDREVKYLINKIRLFKPKKPEKPAEEKPTEDTGVADEKVNVEEEVKEETPTIEEPEINAQATENGEGEIKPSAVKDDKDSHTELYQLIIPWSIPFCSSCLCLAWLDFAILFPVIVELGVASLYFKKLYLVIDMDIEKGVKEPKNEDVKKEKSNVDHDGEPRHQSFGNRRGGGFRGNRFGGRGGPNRSGDREGNFNHRNDGDFQGGPRRGRGGYRGGRDGGGFNRQDDMDLGGMDQRGGGRGPVDKIQEKLNALSGPTFDLPPIDMSEKKFNGRNRLYVGNIGNEVTEEDLIELFKPFGETAEIFVNKEKNFGFVKLDYHMNAEKAKNQLDGTVLKGRNLKIRFAPNTATIKVRNITPMVTNELLHYAFSPFGEIEKAIVCVDERGKPTGEGIVHFTRKFSATLAVRKCTEGCFFLTSSLQPIVVEPFEVVDDQDGYSDKNINKRNPDFMKEREQGPRLAHPNSFEFDYGQRWKALFELHRQKEEALKKDLQLEKEKLVAQMEYSRYEHETEMLRNQLRAREMDKERQKREWEMKERQAEEERQRTEEAMRRSQEEMEARMLASQEDMRRRQQENNLFMQAHNLDSLLDQTEQAYDTPSYADAPAGGGVDVDPKQFMSSYERHNRYEGHENVGSRGSNVGGRGHWVSDRRDDFQNKRRRF